MRKSLFPAAAITLALAACGTPDTVDERMLDTEETPAAATEASATLTTAEGEERGRVTASQSGDTVAISLEATDMDPGTYGVHVHMVGRCDGPTFESAGAHWNPDDSSHGLDNPDGQHAGDMPNIEIGEDGTGTLEYTLEGGATFDGLLDADGSSFIIHASADDQRTDPSGNSGDRVACGVFETAGGTITTAM